MANRISLLCLILLVCLSVTLIECRPGRSGGRGGSRGGSRSRSGGSHSGWGWGGGSHSSSGHTSSGHTSYSSGHTSYSSGYTPYSSGSIFSSFGTNYRPLQPTTSLSGSSGGTYPLSSGLSGSNKHPSSGSSNFGYPKSTTGLSGSNSNNVQPTSKANGGSQNYPSSSSGLSGGNNNNPPSISGHSYPASTTKLSGAGHNQPSQNINTMHGYPSSGTGLSGSGSSKPPNTPGVYGSTSYNTNNGHRQGINNHGSQVYPKANYGTTHNVPHYTATNYYSSPQYVYITEYRNSGSRYSDLLTGLALYNMGRSHSHYHDKYYYDDYYRRRYEPSNSYASSRPQDSATCTMKIKEDNKVEILKIPCEIVSTFSISETKSKGFINQTVCVTNTTTVNQTVIGNVTLSNTTMSNITVTNTTACTSTINGTDPLSVKGPPVNTSSSMECSVGIETKYRYVQNNVDCNVLLKYSKLPEPKKQESIIMPSRAKLKTWLTKPPWWMSLFISV